ncbi:MAG: hypothetical protein ABF703_03945 [Oenococcus sp.]|uniref:toxin-antitoxin system YwqK family antitoxin n=1 Tax=Oenococcus TaxID=46254 RepID=UPI0021E7584F|nr:hypothetical protein [Oenococcus kitaharae]MCV3296118.1 hypothetical protein [Oenococcus kitaharae]
MDEDNIIKKEKNLGMPVTGILKRKSRKAAMAANKAAREAKAKAALKLVDETPETSETVDQPAPSVSKSVKPAENDDFYRNGQAKFQDADGQRTYYFSDGTVKARGSFDGKMQGEWQFFKNTGRLWQIGHLKDDLKDGKWLRFSDAGIIEKSQNFKNGELLKN